MGNIPEYRRAYQQGEKYKAWRRKHRRKIGYADTHRYEKTPQGFMMRLYRNMESRVGGIQKLKAHLYKGKKLLPREEFYKWAWNSPDFFLLYSVWKKGGCQRKFTPSVNRIDAKKGYTIDNMEWLTHSQNSALTSRRKKT